MADGAEGDAATAAHPPAALRADLRADFGREFYEGVPLATAKTLSELTQSLATWRSRLEGELATQPASSTMLEAREAEMGMS